ncbi:MAG TPA: hypothetical protein DCW68_06770 [Rhodospirillaceae bacterium]|nr:MAG: hypothetical protein A2018_01280 [Alphaproteobacteria bacterium GWF2_58_20]HAU29790.1 hypothetical protein [Rhodospirillaceae bacterium]
MAGMRWNEFISRHRNHFEFSSVVSSSIGCQFDKGKKRLPTPYSLFTEWLDKTMTGAWTSVSHRLPGNVTILRVLIDSDIDAGAIKKRFGIIAPKKNLPKVGNEISIGYKDSSYGELAEELGYRVNRKPRNGSK